MKKTSVQCRKKGTTSYKEHNEEFLALPEFDDLQIKCMEAAGIEVEVFEEGFLSSLRKKKKETPEQKKERQIKKKEKLLKTYTRLKKHADNPHSDLANRKKATAEETEPNDSEEDLNEFFGPKNVTPKNSPSNTKSVEVGKKYPARQNGRPVDVTYDSKGNKSVTKMSNMKAGVMQYKHGSTWGLNKEDVDNDTMSEGTRINQYGNCYCVGFTWRGKYMIMKIFFPEVKKPNRKEVEETLCKIYPGCKVHRFDAAPYNPNEPMIHSGMKEETAA